MLYDHSRAKDSLNGPWHFQVDWYDSCLRAQWFAEKVRDETGRPVPVDYDFEQWEETPVPSCWNVQADKYYLL